MPIAIRYLKICNYRSIDELELHDIPAFAVFAGANGSGKSNFFDVLDFVRLMLRFDVKEALQRHGGWENIRCVKSDKLSENTFLLEFQIKSNTAPHEPEIKYILRINEINSDTPQFMVGCPLVEEMDKKTVNQLKSPQEIGELFLHARLYRIEPRGVKALNMSTHDNSELQRYGQNLAVVLRRLEKNDEVRETIIDWLQLIVPQLEIVQTETEKLTGSAQLAFKEKDTDKLFPAHLISDGTIYLLCLLVAMLDRPKTGITLIEEPERGLHPKAIMELINGFREHATIENPIWLTTHSESVVRMLKDNELWLVDKKNGKTQINPVRNIQNLHLNLDEAWLSNVLNGGLPW